MSEFFLEKAQQFSQNTFTVFPSALRRQITCVPNWTGQFLMFASDGLGKDLYAAALPPHNTFVSLLGPDGDVRPRHWRQGWRLGPLWHPYDAERHAQDLSLVTPPNIFIWGLCNFLMDRKKESGLKWGALNSGTKPRSPGVLYVWGGLLPFLPIPSDNPP